MIKAEFRKVQFSEEISKNITFETNFTKFDNPIVTIVFEPSPGYPHINFFASNLTKSGMTVNASAKCTGIAHIHIFSAR